MCGSSSVKDMANLGDHGSLSTGDFQRQTHECVAAHGKEFDSGAEI